MRMCVLTVVRPDMRSQVRLVRELVVADRASVFLDLLVNRLLVRLLK